MRLFALLLLCVTTPVAFSAGPCATTPAAAIKAYAENVTGDASIGFRVVNVRTDLLLNVTWADINRCDHPEWPGFSLATRTQLPAASGKPFAAHSPAVVRAGETVRVWRHESNARLEMAAISDEGGAIGDRIRLHVANANGQPVRFCFGLVRGPHNVEMEQ